MTIITEMSPSCGTRALCAALDLPAATYYRATRATAVAHTPRRRTPPRALPPAERKQVLDVLHAPRFVDLAPAQVYASLLDEGTYYCSERTMYRVLGEQHEVMERRAHRRHPVYAAPELLATAPNQLWSWDITKLKGPVKWSWYQLYVILDVFSRYVVGWMVAPTESAALAERLIGASCKRQNIRRGQLTVHADRGSSMTSRTVALLLADLGVTKTHSRPHVSNDNPYSEAHFKTLKYRPDFPQRFGSLEDARAHCTDSFPGTTPSTGTQVSGCTRRTMCTSGLLKLAAVSERKSSPQHMQQRQNDLFVVHPRLRHYQPRHGKIHPSSSSQRTLVSKLTTPGVSNSLTGSGRSRETRSDTCSRLQNGRPSFQSSMDHYGTPTEERGQQAEKGFLSWMSRRPEDGAISGR